MSRARNLESCRIFYCNNMKEIWKSIKGYEGVYEISSLGRIKSLKRIGCKKDRILKGGCNNIGYLQIILSKDNKLKNRTIHQLVAVAFLGHVICGHKLVVNHKDGNTKNNNVSNLEIIT